MNKSELIASVAEKTGQTKTASAAALNAVLDAIAEQLAQGVDVALVGFGTFKVGKRKARKGRNPATGVEIDIPASKMPKFVPGKTLKARL